MKKFVSAVLIMFSAMSWANTDGIERSGDVVHLLLPATALSTTLFYEDTYEGSWQLLKAAVSSRAVVEGLKLGISKDRPDGGGSDSFPSGHTSDSFMAATFIHQRYGWQYGLPAYLAASYVGYTRVESNQHYLEDVLTGAAIGALAGWYYAEPYPGVFVTPLSHNGAYGLSLSGKF